MRRHARGRRRRPAAGRPDSGARMPDTLAGGLKMRADALAGPSPLPHRRWLPEDRSAPTVACRRRRRRHPRRPRRGGAGAALLPPLQPIGGKDPDPKEVERRARLMATALGRLPLDGAVPGETDLALGLARLKRLASGAHLPFLAANLLDRAGHPAFPA